MINEINTTDYRLILKEELATRCRQNARYSLRAFARDLSLAPSRLSEVLNGKQGLSRKAAIAIAEALGYVGSEKDRFCDLVEAAHARSKKDREAARIRLRKYTHDSEMAQLKVDYFRAISDWYHLGILELLQFNDFSDDPKWIAKQLGISEIEVRLAVDRLERLELVKRETGKLVPAQGHGKIPSDIPSDGIKKFHTQILEKAKRALYTQSVEQREYGTVVFAVDKTKLKEAKQEIRDFQHKFCKQMGEGSKKDGLYALSFQFFDLLSGG